MTAASADELAALEFFADCPTESLVPLAAQLRPLTAAPGQVLMRRANGQCPSWLSDPDG